MGRKEIFISKMDRDKGLRYIKYTDGYEVLIKFDKNYNRIESINSKGDRHVYITGITPSLTMNDLIDGRRIRGRKFERRQLEEELDNRTIIDNSKEIIKYDGNGNIIYWFDGDSKWYRALYDNHMMIYFENEKGEISAKKYDENKEQWLETKSTNEVISNCLKTMLEDIRFYFIAECNIPKTKASSYTNGFMKHKGITWLKWFICTGHGLNDLRNDLVEYFDNIRADEPATKDERKLNESIKADFVDLTNIDNAIQYTTSKLSGIDISIVEYLLDIGNYAKILLANFDKSMVYRNFSKYYSVKDGTDVIRKYDEIKRIEQEAYECCNRTNIWVEYEILISPTVDQVVYEFMVDFGDAHKKLESSTVAKMAFNRIMYKMGEYIDFDLD